MLTTPHKRFVWSRTERFTDFSEFSFFRAQLERQRHQQRLFREQAQPNSDSERWKPAPWTPWLWVKEPDAD